MQSRSQRVRPKVIDFNLLPSELRRPLVGNAVLLLVVAIVAAAFLFVRIYDVRRDAAEQLLDLKDQIRSTKGVIQTENNRVAAEKTEVAKLEEQIKRVKEEVARYSAKPVANVRREISIAPVVEVALARQPSGLRLASLSWQDPKLTLRGEAANVQTVVAYADELRQSGYFSQVRLQQVEPAADKAEAGAKPEAPRTGPTATPTPVRLIRTTTTEVAFVLELTIGREAAR